MNALLICAAILANVVFVNPFVGTDANGHCNPRVVAVPQGGGNAPGRHLGSSPVMSALYRNRLWHMKLL